MKLNSVKRVRTLVFALLAAGAALAAGCSSDDDGGGAPTIDCTTATPVTFAQVSVFSSTCNSCHSVTKTTPADRKNAPVDINFDDFASAKAHANTAQSEVAGGDMPPAGFTGPQPTEAQKTELYTWVQCGTAQ